MFGLLNRSPRRNVVVRRSVRLSLERLEDRLSPSGIDPVGDPTATTGGTTASDALTMTVTYEPNKQVAVSGHLTSANNMVQAIQFGGVVNATAITDNNGDYSAVLTIPQLGQLTATEGNGQSNTVTTTLVSGTPTITFSATALGDGVWLFSGTVAGAPTQGEVVNFGGITPLDGQSTSVNADGSYSFTCIVNNGQGGCATAQAVDWWGDSSQEAMTSVPV